MKQAISYYLTKDIGGRDEQQDSNNIFYNKACQAYLMVLGDGMGGHSGGALASQTLIKCAKAVFDRYTALSIDDVSHLFTTIIDTTYGQLQQIVAKNSGIDPHTTATLTLIKDDWVIYGHIGDSRVYIFEQEEGFIIRSRDHSVPQMLLDMGEITEEEMATHPDQNRLTKSLSAKRAVKISIAKQRIVTAGKYYGVLLCSDGFWEYCNQDEMYQLLFDQSLTLEDRVNKALSIVKQRGGKEGDNISISVALIDHRHLKTSDDMADIINEPSKTPLSRYFFTLLVGLVILAFALLIVFKKETTPQQKPPPSPTTHKSSDNLNDQSPTPNQESKPIEPITTDTEIKALNTNDPNKTATTQEESITQDNNTISE